MNSKKNILIFNPFGIGDVLFTTPLLRNLKDLLPEVKLIYLCNRRVFPLLKSNVFLDEVLVFEKDEWRDIAEKSKPKFIKKFINFYKELKSHKFDIVFDLSMNSQYGFFLKLVGIKKRIGFNFKKRGRFLTDKIEISEGYHDKHVADYCLELLKFLGLTPKPYRFDLFLPSESSKFATNFLENLNIKNTDKLIGVCPGSGDSWRDTAFYKRWPKDNFLELSSQLSSIDDTRVFIFGSESESDVCGYVGDNSSDRVLNLCGQLNLGEFSALVSKLDILITNDGGPFHIAQSLGVKSIVFYGPVDDKVYGPYPDHLKAIVFAKSLSCRPCYKRFRFTGCGFDKRCLSQIEVQEVVSAVKNYLLL